ncbi:hypothetical protein FWK35_00007088 [Aphis craccivora]|uniref:Uncharacterized protein n=1 Tax=Aphis craccivora TaxID=307492 RepID=A0A6G0YG11_APHCR|nr:hypothetical protein FWK35_00007088 [Aphis craccivora]
MYLIKFNSSLNYLQYLNIPVPTKVNDCGVQQKSEVSSATNMMDQFDLILADNNNSLKQLSNYSDLRRNIEFNKSRIFLPLKFDFIPSRSLLKYDEIEWVYYTLSEDFDKFKKIVLNKNHDISNTNTFRRLVSILRKLPNRMFREKHEALYRCHIDKLHIIQHLLNTSLEKINKSKNHIIHFLVYDMFLEFSHFIRMCLFYKNKRRLAHITHIEYLEHHNNSLNNIH